MTTGARGTLEPGMVGATVGPITHAIDARWLMAYAASLGETDPRYYDTRAAGGPLPHPLFPVCYEWPAAVALRDKTVPPALQPQSVHATHHLVIHRHPRAGDMLQTTGRVIDVAPRRSGTLVVSRFETLDADGNRVSTTDYGSVYRNVALAGAPIENRHVKAAAGAAGAVGGTPNLLVSVPPAAPAAAAAAVAWQDSIDVPANAAWVYTECARIWNPIHTDVAVARGAGLRAPILHGTATLALAVSRLVARELGGRAERVREIRVRFTGMVPMPSRFVVRARGADAAGLSFDAVAPDGAPILSQGALST